VKMPVEKFETNKRLQQRASWSELLINES